MALVNREITQEIIGAAIEVHKHSGPGLLDSTYEECLVYELKKLGLTIGRQVDLPILYKGNQLDAKYRLDLLVNEQVVVELKSCSKIEPIHEAQLLTYLKLSGLTYGLLINFNVPMLRHGLKRIINS